MRVLKMKAWDYIFMLITLVLPAGVIVLNMSGLIYTLA